MWGYSYNNILKRGVRIALRSKVNDSCITGLRVIDSILSVGRGQRQLILGDRYTGKSAIFLSLVIKSNSNNWIGTMEGFGSGRIFGVYIGINFNLSKLSFFISALLLYTWYSLILATHSASSSLLSYIIPMIGVSIGERLRDRGLNIVIGFDDLSKHSKSYRQIKLIIGSIPTRDAFPADIFNIHSALLERCGKYKYSYFGGSITAFPVIETISSDITEYIATNVISITDGQFYLSKDLFLDTIRPAINSGLSVSRIGTNAQCKWMKLIGVGIKNEITYLRMMELSQYSLDFIKLNSLNCCFFQDYLVISSDIYCLILLLLYRNGISYNSSPLIHRLFFTLNYDYLYCYYILFICKNNYSILHHSLLLVLLLFSLLLINSNHYINLILILSYYSIAFLLSFLLY